MTCRALCPVDIAENKPDTVPALGELAEIRKMRWEHSTIVATLSWESWRLQIGDNM